MISLKIEMIKCMVSVVTEYKQNTTNKSKSKTKHIHTNKEKCQINLEFWIFVIQHASITALLNMLKEMKKKKRSRER